jgi:hypothetical protein
MNAPITAVTAGSVSIFWQGCIFWLVILLAAVFCWPLASGYIDKKSQEDPTAYHHCPCNNIRPLKCFLEPVVYTKWHKKVLDQ